MKKKLLALSAAALAATTMSTGAEAAVLTPTISGASGSFENPNVTCTTGNTVPCQFTDTVSFVTPAGFNSVSSIISSTFNVNNPATQLNFTSVVLNGFAFTIQNGNFDLATLNAIPLAAGATNTLTITGQTFGDASLSGTLSFGTVAAVPEPGTWALMLLGFGAIGYSMRRRRRTGAHILQAA